MDLKEVVANRTLHTATDGLPPREVFVDGKKVQFAFFADTRRGLVRAYPEPPRLHKYGKRPIWRTFRGTVEVRLA